jgi:ankyrin repeat protein
MSSASHNNELDHEQVQFRFQVAKCMEDPNKVTRIWATLNSHHDGAMLARSVDKDGRTPLHLAAENDDVELGRVLVCFGADVDAEDREPASVLDFAVANNHDKFVEFLIGEGANESQVAEKNQIRFKELQQVIEVRKAHKMKGIRTPTRTQSLTSTRPLSITTRVRNESIV